MPVPHFLRRAAACACLCFGLLCLIGMPDTAVRAASDAPSIKSPWVREAPPVVKTHAGYLVISNSSDHPIQLMGVSSPQYKMAELHLSKVEGGVATMIKQRQITIPAKGEIEMKPGGFHIMLMQPKAPLKAGDIVEVVLHFADGESVAFTAPVKKSSGSGKSKPHGHGMHGHQKTN